MENTKEFEHYVKYLKEYYSSRIDSNHSLTIIGMNDDRGFNIHKNILMNLKDILESGKYDIELLDLYSMFFNKTRHIDYYLKHNINMEEIRLMQEYGTTKELNHALGFTIPFMGGVSKTFNKFMLTKTPIKGERKDIRISDKIKQTERPLIMYASGLNDIMYELDIDPFNLKRSYMNRATNPRYDYACERVNQETIKKIIDGHEKNFSSILGINDNSDIYVLGAYFYSDMKEDYERKFREAILMYNENLEKLCSTYNISYINCRFLENTKYNSPLANYLSKYPSQMIADEIIKKMYQNTLVKKCKKQVNPFVFDNMGAAGIIEELKNDIEEQENISKITTDYDKQVSLEKKDEHNRELDVFEKVLKTTHKKRLLS